MAYLFREKLNLLDLVGIEQARKKILIYQPEEYLASLYAHYLKFHNFDVKHCPNLDQIKKQSESFQPHALIFSVDEGGDGFSIPWLVNFKRHSPNTVVLTTGLNNDSEMLKKLLSAGVSSHINRRHSRPQDIAVVIKALLR